MMDQEAVVISVEGELACVEVGGAGSGCGRCYEEGGCQSGILGKLFRSKPRQYRIANPIGAVPGQHVVVRVAEGAALRAALLIYAVPVLSLILGAMIGATLGDARNDDAAAALGGLAGLALGILAGLALRTTRIGKVENPVLIRNSSSFCLSKEAVR